MPDRTRPIRKEICLNEQELSVVRHKMNQLGTRRWIAKVTSSLHDLLPVSQQSCKTKFLESSATIEKPEVNFTNIAQTGIYSYKGFEYCQRLC